MIQSKSACILDVYDRRVSRRKYDFGKFQRGIGWVESVIFVFDPAKLQQLQLARPGNRLGTAFDAQLRKDVANVLFHRVQGEHQPLGDVLVGTTISDQAQNV